MASFILRPAEFEDTAAIAEIRYAGLRELYGAAPNTEAFGFLTPEKLLRDAEIEIEHVMVSEIDGKVAGCCRRCACRDADTPYCGEIRELFVRKEARGKGIGREFLKDALAVLYIDGFKTCKVWVPEKNSALCAFFENAGFLRDGTRRVLQAGDTPVLFCRLGHALTRPEKKYYR